MGVPENELSPKGGATCVPKTEESRKKPTTEKDEEPPEIPPRMKKKGPELPEKPPHLRLATLMKINPSSALSLSSQAQFSKSLMQSVPYGKHREPSTDQKLFLDNVRKKTASSDREILIAATRGSRERPPEKRQREPAKLLTSTFKAPEDETEPNDALPILLGLASPKPPRKSGYHGLAPAKPVSFKTNSSSKASSRNSRHPVLLIPRSQLDTRNLQQFWSSYPVSYGVWVQNSGSGDPQVSSRMVRKAHGPSGVELRSGMILSSKGQRKPTGHHSETKIFVNAKNSKSSGPTGLSSKPRSSSVTRSGSLTSHGSTSSDSGNEGFPKSVLKKHRREPSTSASSKKSSEQKKNVTFNAFATVQVMEE